MLMPYLNLSIEHVAKSSVSLTLARLHDQTCPIQAFYTVVDVSRKEPRRGVLAAHSLDGPDRACNASDGPMTSPAFYIALPVSRPPHQSASCPRLVLQRSQPKVQNSFPFGFGSRDGGGPEEQPNPQPQQAVSVTPSPRFGPESRVLIFFVLGLGVRVLV
jgi:hypothetical protein